MPPFSVSKFPSSFKLIRLGLILKRYDLNSTVFAKTLFPNKVLFTSTGCVWREGWLSGLEHIFRGDTIQFLTLTSSYETRQNMTNNTIRSIKYFHSEALVELREGFTVYEL